MRVLIQDAAHPFRRREQKNVVAIAVRPVRNGNACFMARHQTANADETQRRQRRQNGETMQPAIVGNFIHSKTTSKKGNRCEHWPAAVLNPQNYLTSSVKSAVAFPPEVSTSFSTPV